MRFAINEKLESDLIKALAKISQMINANKGIADENSLGLFYLIESVLKRIVGTIDQDGTVEMGLYEEFNKVKQITVRAFEGTVLDDLIWQISSNLTSR
jgi:phage tail protein X